MDSPFDFGADALTPEDIAALRQLADRLWNVRHAVAAEWSRRLTEILPDDFRSNPISLDQLVALNEGFLTLILDQAQQGDMTGLYNSFYDMNRWLIDADLQQTPLRPISLTGLYTSSRVSLQVIQEQLGAGGDRQMLAYAKLTAQLMMLVGRAYSDAREAYLQRVFEQINTLSHELRAPLSHLFGYLEMLRIGDFGPVSHEQERVLSQLIHETDDVLWLLTGTLDLSRLDTGRVDVRVEEFPLTTVLTELVNATPHDNVHITWSVAPDLPPLRTDRVKIKQIVGNLLRNAVRYGGGSAVAISVAVPRPDMVEVSVRDHGPGIQPEDLQVIFDFFERGPAARLARDGYGIGLHVVRRLVGLLGGTIAVESTPGEGACFRFVIPMRHSEPLLAAAAS